jgi:hypothetical protein
VCDLSVWGSSELGRTDLAAKQRRARISDDSASSLGVQSLAFAGVQATGSVQGQMRLGTGSLGADIMPHVSFKRKLLAVCDIILASPPCSPACSRSIISASSPPNRTPLASNVSNTPMTPPVLQRRNVNNFMDLLEIVLDVNVDDGQRIFPVRLPAPVLRRIVDLLFPGTSLATPRPIKDAEEMPNLLDWASTLYHTGECVGVTAAEGVCTARLRVMRQVAKELAAPPDLASLLLLVLTCSVVVSPTADSAESDSARRLVTASNAPGACPYTLVFLSSEWGYFCEVRTLLPTFTALCMRSALISTCLSPAVPDSSRQRHLAGTLHLSCSPLKCVWTHFSCGSRHYCSLSGPMRMRRARRRRREFISLTRAIACDTWCAKASSIFTQGHRGDIRSRAGHC